MPIGEQIEWATAIFVNALEALGDGGKVEQQPDSASQSLRKLSRRYDDYWNSLDERARRRLLRWSLPKTRIKAWEDASRRRYAPDHECVRSFRAWVAAGVWWPVFSGELAEIHQVEFVVTYEPEEEPPPALRPWLGGVRSGSWPIGELRGGGTAFSVAS